MARSILHLEVRLLSHLAYPFRICKENYLAKSLRRCVVALYAKDVVTVVPFDGVLCFWPELCGCS